MPKIYRNKKNRALYVVLHEAVDCTNDHDHGDVIVYQLLSNLKENICVREKSEFEEKFELVETPKGMNGTILTAQAEEATWPEIVKEATSL